MTRPRATLPSELGDSFTFAEATRLGVTPGQLRVPALLAPTRGVRIATPDPDLITRARAYTLVLPSPAAFSHRTAATLLGLPMPHTDDELLDVTVPSGRRVRRVGVRSHQGFRNILVANGIRVTSHIDTWLDLAAALSLRDLVILGDAIVGQDKLQLQRLRGRAINAKRMRGAVVARRAAGLVRCGVLSPQETLWRLRMLEYGLPEPLLTVAVHDREGNWLGIGDFVWLKQKLIAEYDGEYHFTHEQRRADQLRRRRMRHAGWNVIELNSADNYAPRAALEALRVALNV
ncbi:DUF559 domain-containing protein [Rudaeicoccus suwonensis]|uniref:Uncharacterized protein DUF559 n=1 Tax=Rudaeicoccus suwonensis TaxID=657409 RepID=A0A561EB84_9MICO|nr:DUF559 domain-containing protein [Rudaeicoccus suwonensis]TWE12875.1 uncharacterized protein DUF559 [Rudaeicoccus suwonensis]